MAQVSSVILQDIKLVDFNMVQRKTYISTLIKKTNEFHTIFMKILSVNKLIDKPKKIRIHETTILWQIEVAVEAGKCQQSDTREIQFTVDNRVVIINASVYQKEDPLPDTEG